MTKKRFKVWDKENWGAVKWVDTRMEQLVHQVEQLPNNHLRMFTYTITSPIPPLLASGKENYTMVKTVQRIRFSKEIAEETIATQGAFAHLYALEKLERERGNAPLWRDVLTWIDELGGDDGGGNQRGDITGCRTQLQGSAEDDS